MLAQRGSGSQKYQREAPTVSVSQEAGKSELGHHCSVYTCHHLQDSKDSEPNRVHGTLLAGKEPSVVTTSPTAMWEYK